MSLINRMPVTIGRAERKLRDDRVFVVASEDSYAPKQYFDSLALPRVRVIVIPTPTDTCESAPKHVVERLEKAYKDVRSKGEIQENDEFWVMIDTDHHVAGNHLSGTYLALKEARQKGFELAVSNPCFELWLLLHHIDVAPGEAFEKAKEVATRLQKVLGGYNKTAIAHGRFPLSLVPKAIHRARTLESDPDHPEGWWPISTGTRVYRLMERILAGCS